MVGKYAEHFDAYKSIYESLDHAGIHNHAQVRIGRILSEAIEGEGPERLLAGYDGILVPGGFGERGIEGKVDAIRFARERKIPFLGICLGMQCAAIEFGRNVVGLTDAHSTEFNKDTPHPVICLLDEQRNVTDKGGTMRLGAHPTRLEPDSQARRCYGSDDDLRTASASLRVQQRLPPAVHGPRRDLCRDQPRRRAGRDHGTAVPSLVRRGPVPSRIQVETDRRSPPVRRLRRRRCRTPPGTCRTTTNHGENREMTDSQREQPAQNPKSKIIVDEDWKTQVQAEKDKLQHETPDGSAAEDASYEIPDASFSVLVTTLATQAAVALGQTGDPDATEVVIDLALARHFIDTLGILEEKTKGNLSGEEAALLSNILHQLRMAFVAVQGQLDKQQPPPEKKSSIELP